MDAMPYFELCLGFAPSFHRPGAIRVEGDVTGVATFESGPTGLFPGLAFALPVESERMATLFDCCLGMLTGWDKRWSKSGLDGIGIEGTFDSTEATPRTFTLWSPRCKGAPQAMIRAALDCFPVERCSGVAEAGLENMRSYFDLQPPVTVYAETPIRLRLAPHVGVDDANEVETRVRALPGHVDLIVDLSGADNVGRVLAQVLPMQLLLERSQAVRWIVYSTDADALIASGVNPITIRTIKRERISNNGHPLVLGGVVVSCPELISLARSRSQAALATGLMREYRITSEQAARGSVELIDFMQAYQIQSN
ncbi:hypothetical protein [Massilia sp. CCM 8734]|uniref:hypothetical protein n=1 Tax=Massilia sp. CCM 8734 TaxID=2609283 RepID=UPI001420E9CC|nr:hypothetical protein [Massilia sp. CCM 8734]NIA00348.1 hypothetical protein [Massilia sp. CCM 8734]